MILGFIKLKLNFGIYSSDMGSHRIIQLSYRVKTNSRMTSPLTPIVKPVDRNGWFNWLQSD